MYTLTAVVDRFEKGKAVIKFDDGQELVLAKRQLPDSIESGSALTFEIFRQQDDELRRHSVAHYLLKEILDEHQTKEPPH